MPIINITVRDKIAYREDGSLPFIVSGNSDYVVVFDFDSEWEEYMTKTARFIMGGGYTDVVFDGCECAIPTLRGGGVLEVGVYAGDIHTTTSAEIGVKPCVTSGGEENDPPTPNIYAQIMEKLNELVAAGGDSIDDGELKIAIEEALAAAKASGEFDGKDGRDGADGAPGPQGPQGDKGDKGDTGAQGPKGDKGDTGAQGPKGDKGDTGAQGPKGDKGDTGAQGSDGIGIESCYIDELGQLIVVFTDDCGEMVVGDVIGPQGDKGDKGDKGDTGAQGPAYTLTSADKSSIASAVKASLTKETWTFELGDGTTVTKAVYIG